VHNIIKYSIFPVMMIAGLMMTHAFIASGMPMLVAAYLVIFTSMALMFLLESRFIYRPRWAKADNDVRTDMLHGAISYVLIPLLEKPLLIVLLAGSADWLSRQFGGQLWPDDWPLWAQLILALLASDAGRYWGHRLAHEVPFLWRFHAVHHSPKRLYWLNAVRQHPVDRIWFYFTEIIGLILLGAHGEVIALYAVFNAIHGFFQHTNIDVRLGPLNWIVNVAELHRWHHSVRPDDSNNNYGNNLIVFDVLFGTRYLPPDDVDQIGLINRDYPQTYWQQFLAPFRRGNLHDTPSRNA